MAGVDSGDVTDDAAARQAAEVAVELTETGGPADKKRIAARLQGVADRTAAAAALRRGERPPGRGLPRRAGARRPPAGARTVPAGAPARPAVAWRPA